MSVRERLVRLLDFAPDGALAIEFEDQWWTWGQLRSAARAVQVALDAAGIQPDGRVGVVLENRPELVATVLAVLTSGRTLVTLSGLQPTERLGADVERSQVPVVIASPSALDKGAAFGGRPVLSIDAEGSVTKVSSDDTLAEDILLTRPGIAIEMLTSGTTGTPKRVSLSDEQLNRSMVSGGQRAGSPDHLSKSASIVMTPLVHIGGLWGVLSTLYSGRRIILLTRFNLDEWVRAVETHKPRASGLVPAAIRSVLDANIAPERLSSLEVITTGTAPCPADLADEFFRTYRVAVLAVYGATEFAGAVAGWTLPLHHEWWEKKKGSAGRAFHGVELRITDEDGLPIANGISGHLEIKTRQAPEGGQDWVRTSDYARLDEDEFLWIEGRSDNAIIRGGFKIAPDTVKRVLESHPAVREAGVAPLPDPRLGAVPVAAVELLPGAPRPTSDELKAYCRTKLLPYEVPTQIVIVDELPRTPSMKISQVELLELIKT